MIPSILSIASPAVGHLFGPDCTGIAQKEVTKGQDQFQGYKVFRQILPGGLR
jgi:hypothetical protein